MKHNLPKSFEGAFFTNADAEHLVGLGFSEAEIRSYFDEDECIRINTNS